MAKILVIGVLLLSLLIPTPAVAQLAVTDAPVLAAITALATTIKSMVDDVRRQAEALANWGAIVAELQVIAQLMADIEALVAEVESLNGGWDTLITSGNVLCSIDEAVEWKGQALQWQQNGLGIARRAQRLMGRTVNVMASLQAVLSGIIGSTSGAQGASALLALIAANLQQLQTMTGAFHAGTMGGDVIESVIGIQLVCIHGNHMAGWGSYSYQ
jgi:hypothetical protein